MTRPDPWGSALYEKTTGTLGTVAVGPYSQDVSAFPNTTPQTEDLAEWVVNVGTTDVQRWPEVTVDWRNAASASSYDLPALTVGAWIKLVGLPTYVGPDVTLQIVGIREEIGFTGARTTYVTRPADPWRVLIWDNATYGVWADSAAPATTDSRWGL